MSLFIPSSLMQEHMDFRNSNQSYNSVCQEIDTTVRKPNIDPSTIDISVVIPSVDNWKPILQGLISSMPVNLGKLWLIFLTGQDKNSDYIRSVVHNTSEITLIRLYAIGNLMGANDSVSESDFKTNKSWVVSDVEKATISDLFMNLYDSSDNSVKQDDYLSDIYCEAYCVKQRKLWYPLGEKKILDNIYHTLIDKFEINASDSMKLRIDREYNVLAAYYYWAGETTRATEVCNRILNRPLYQYTFNAPRIQCRCLLANIKIGQDKFLEAAQFLKMNIQDYNTMKDSAGFNGLNTGSVHENDLFLVYMLKTYELLESISEKNFNAEKALLVRNRSGKNMEEKIKDLDIHDHRHQWKEHVKQTKSRVSGLKKIVKLHELLSA